MLTEPGDLTSRAQGRIGTVLRGKYRIDRVLGVGGMAVVFKATHRNEAEFAVKMLHPELSIHENVRTRFLREGKAANSVRDSPETECPGWRRGARPARREEGA
jgi:serine/threonine-protein kinase